MSRIAAALAAVTGVVGAAAAVPVWLLAPADPLPARFGPADCGRVGLVDARTGWRVSGAEDLALAPGDLLRGGLLPGAAVSGAALIVAAHDRADPARPDGGLYAIDVAALAPGGTATARPLVGTRQDMPFRPHGIALSADARRLAIVNRIGPAEAVVEIGALGPDGWTPERLLRDARLCRANDLAFTGGGDALEITLDRADCTTSLRDLRGGTGSVVRAEGDRLVPIRTGLAFPNGTDAGHVAETRADRLLRPDGSAVELPGAPDNLTAVSDGLVVAVHPSLLRLWLYLRGWSERAPARILLVGDDGAVETLYDDPEGERFSAATTAVLAGGRLIAGSVRDAGLLVCGPAG